MAIQRPFSGSLIAEGYAEQVAGRRVTANFFRCLGLSPRRGVTLPATKTSGAPPRYCDQFRPLGTQVRRNAECHRQESTLDGRIYSIVGVLPASFDLYPGSDVYVPLGSWTNSGLQERSAGLAFQGIGRIKPGITFEQAQADLDRVMRNLADAYPEIVQPDGSLRRRASLYFMRAWLFL